jgi:hypothetical protein
MGAAGQPRSWPMFNIERRPVVRHSAPRGVGDRVPGVQAFPRPPSARLEGTRGALIPAKRREPQARARFRAPDYPRWRSPDGAWAGSRRALTGTADACDLGAVSAFPAADTVWSRLHTSVPSREVGTIHNNPPRFGASPATRSPEPPRHRPPSRYGLANDRATRVRPVSPRPPRCGT